MVVCWLGGYADTDTDADADADANVGVDADADADEDADACWAVDLRKRVMWQLEEWGVVVSTIESQVAAPLN